MKIQKLLYQSPQIRKFQFEVKLIIQMIGNYAMPSEYSSFSVQNKPNSVEF